MVKGHCVLSKVLESRPSAKHSGTEKKKKHIGVLGSRKTKNLPFTK
jgi:hypothetical protein